MVNRLINIILALSCLAVAYELAKVLGRADTLISADTTSHAAPDAQKLLGRHIPNFQLNHVTFEEALTALSDLARVNIVVHWSSFNSNWSLRTATVALHMTDTTLRDAIETVFQNLDLRPGAVPRYYVEDGIIHVTSSEGISVATEMFNVRPLVGDLEKWYLNSAMPPRRPLGGIDKVAEEDDPLGCRAQIEWDLIRMIMDTVAPSSWRDAGSTIGSISELGGILVITQTPENLRDIGRLLAHLGKDMLAQSPSIEIAHSSGGVQTAGHKDVVPTTESVQPVVEVIDVRGLIAMLLNGEKAIALQNLAEYRGALHISQGIEEFLRDGIDHDSWILNNGKVGAVQIVAGMMVIRQTPENIEAARRVLRELDRAATESDLAPVPGIRAAGARAAVETARDVASEPGKLVTAYLNIRFLVESPLFSFRQDRKPDDDSPAPAGERTFQIMEFITQAVVPKSWKGAGGPGRIHAVGTFLIVTQTPENLDAVRAAIEQLEISGGNLPSTTGPASQPVRKE